MNEKGNLVLIILGVMILFVVAVPLGMLAFKPLDIIVRIMLVFMIFMTVRGFLGNGIPTLIITGVLIYFLVFKWWWIGAMGAIFVTLLSMGFFGMIVWGTSKIAR